jgi:hypothetical protein
VTGFIGLSQIVITSNYSSVANLYPLQITRTHAKTSQSAFASRFLITDLNNVDSSASTPTSLLSGEYPTTKFIAPPVVIITSRHEPRRKPFFYCCDRVRCHGNVFPVPFPTKGCGSDHRKHCSSIVACKLRTSPSNGRCLQSYCLATGLWATMFTISLDEPAAHPLKFETVFSFKTSVNTNHTMRRQIPEDNKPNN